MTPNTRVALQIVQHLDPGGIETMALDLMRHAEADERMLIVSLEGRRKPSLERWPVLQPFADNLIFLDKQPGWRAGLIWQLARLMKSLGVSSVHTHHIGPLVYGGLAARLAGIKNRIHTEHDAWHLSSARRRRLQGAFLRLVSPILVADAEAVAQGIGIHWPDKSARIIRNGIDTHRFRPGSQRAARAKLGLPVDAKLVGSSGRLESVKGHDVLLDALFRLPNKVHVAIAGDGSQARKLLAQANDLGIASRFHLLGRVDAMPEFYQALDVYCQPSHQEGMPLAPLEAQACGIPTVATAVGGMREAVCPVSGFLVPKGDARQLAERLRLVLGSGSPVNPRDFVERHGNVRLMARSYASLRHTGCAAGV
jgi:glycosyltransferase involved in cell wall biosynthesis